MWLCLSRVLLLLLLLMLLLLLLGPSAAPDCMHHILSRYQHRHQHQHPCQYQRHFVLAKIRWLLCHGW
jgi:hypothetical protein